MRTTPLAKTLFVAGGAWLIISGVGELMERELRLKNIRAGQSYTCDPAYHQSGFTDYLSKADKYILDRMNVTNCRIHSFMALTQRSQGALKVGLGLGLLGAASLSNISTGNTSTGYTLTGNALIDSPLIPKIKPVRTRGFENDFATCFKLYRDRGGTEVAVLSNTWTRGETLTLCRGDGARLGIFSKNNEGLWHMTSMDIR